MDKPDPNCPDCEGSGGVIVALDPYPMGFACECTSYPDEESEESDV